MPVVWRKASGYSGVSVEAMPQSSLKNLHSQLGLAYERVNREQTLFLANAALRERFLWIGSLARLIQRVVFQIYGGFH